MAQYEAVHTVVAYSKGTHRVLSYTDYEEAKKKRDTAVKNGWQATLNTNLFEVEEAPAEAGKAG